MEQVLGANEAIVGILGQPGAARGKGRLLHYCLPVEVPEGVLLFNTLTRELLLLSQEEFAGATENPVLWEKRFVVPEGTDEKKLVDLVRWVQKSMKKPPKRITAYTILTTTDCNARCFYCYEMGRARTPMSDETALKTAAFIKEKSRGKPVRIGWFGGEPLYNYRAIDLICGSLRENGVEFISTMISNGYLFDDEMVARAAGWNLKRVQITLDGTEEVYNRCKAFVYREGSPYQVVTGNIDRLLRNKIAVSVRMNLDFHNAEDLMTLADELARRFGGRPGFRAYAHLIFDDNMAWDARYSQEKWAQLYQAKNRLEEKLLELGLQSTGSLRLRRKLPENQCMADAGNTVVVTPDGHLGVCEHFSETELIGHLDSPERDQAVIDSFRQRCQELPACATCFYYPECLRLKKCPDLIPCIEPERRSIRQQMERTVRNEYRLWRTAAPEFEAEPEDEGHME